MNSSSGAFVQVHHEDRVVKMKSVTESEWREATRLGRQFTLMASLTTSSGTAAVTLFVAGMTSGAWVAVAATAVFGFLSATTAKNVKELDTNVERDRIPANTTG